MLRSILQALLDSCKIVNLHHLCLAMPFINGCSTTESTRWKYQHTARISIRWKICLASWNTTLRLATGRISRLCKKLPKMSGAKSVKLSVENWPVACLIESDVSSHVTVVEQVIDKKWTAVYLSWFNRKNQNKDFCPWLYLWAKSHRTYDQTLRLSDLKYYHSYLYSIFDFFREG